MPSIDSLFINVQTSGVADVPFVVTTAWNSYGKPTIQIISSGALPEGVTIRTLAHPSGVIDVPFFNYLVDPANYGELYTYTAATDSVTGGSGFYTDNRYFASSGYYNCTFDIHENYENTYYTVGYYANYFDQTTSAIYSPLVEVLTDKYLTPASRPQTERLQVTAALSSTEPASSRINLNIIQDREIMNYALSSPKPYLVTISGVGGWYTPTGAITADPSGITNFFDGSISGMLLNLPYLSGTQEAPSIYELTLRWFDQDNNPTSPLIFNTATIKSSIDDFDDGDLNAFADVSIKRVAEIPIKSDVLKKKRYTIGIEDLAVVNETFAKQGLWISDYYTIDDPVYTFFMRVGEIMPALADVNNYDMVKYFVQFQNQDWIRLSPVSRGDELDEEGKIVPKFFVLDRLNLGQISTDLAELPYDFPVFSFRIRIELDMSFLADMSFISPSIDYYECHVTDRNSFLRIE